MLHSELERITIITQHPIWRVSTCFIQVDHVIHGGPRGPFYANTLHGVTRFKPNEESGKLDLFKKSKYLR